MKKGKKKTNKKTRGLIFTTGLTIRELHFPSSYRNGVAHFLDFRGKNILVGRNLKNGRLADKKLILNIAIVKNYIRPTVTETGSQLATE